MDRGRPRQRSPVAVASPKSRASQTADAPQGGKCGAASARRCSSELVFDPETEQLLMEMNRIGLWFDIATHGVATRDAARAPTRSVRAAFQIVLKRRPDFLSMASGRVQVVRRQPGFA